MAKKISSSDLFSQEDLFKGVRDSAQSALLMINQLNAAMKTSAEGLKASIKGADLGSAAGLKGFNQAATEANQLKEEAIRLEIMQAKLTKELEVAEKGRIAAERERLKLENDLAKAAAREAKSAAEKKGAYEALKKSAKDLGNASIELGAQLLALEKSGQANTDEFKNLSVQYEETTKSALDATNQLKELEGRVGRDQRKVGDYAGAIKGMGGEFKSAKAELRALTNEILNMKRGTPEFEAATKRASELKDEIQDLSQELSAGAGNAFEQVAGSARLFGQRILDLDLKGAGAALTGMGNAVKNIDFKTIKEEVGGLASGLKNLGKAVIGNPWFLAAAALTALIVYWKDLKDLVQGTTREVEKLGKANSILEKQNALLEGQVTLAKMINENSKESIELERKKLENDIEIASNELKIQNRIGDINSKRDAENKLIIARNALAQQSLQIEIDRRKAYEDALQAIDEEAYKKLKASQKSDEYQQSEVQTLELIKQKEQALNTLRENERKRKEGANKASSTYNEEEAYFNRQFMVAQSQAVVEINQLKKQAKTFEEARKKALEGELDLEKEINNTLADRLAFERELANAIAKQNMSSYDYELMLLDQQYAEKIAKAKEYGTDLQLVEKWYTEQILIIQENEYKRQEGLFQEYRDALKKQEEDAMKDDEKMQGITLTDLIEREKIKGEIVLRANMEAHFKLTEQAAKNSSDRLAKEKKAEEERQKEINDAVKAGTDLFIQQSERKQAQIQKDLENAKKQYDTLKALAESGNIDAQQSLAAQQKILDEKERQRIAEVKRQERIKLAQSIFSTYSAKLESGDKNALANTIKDATVLTQFVQSLPAFLKGTEDTGVNGYGVDGKGGFLSVLHPNERVVPKELNNKMSGITNEELAKIAVAYKTNEFMTSIPAFQQADSSELISRIDNLTKVLKDKPETNIALGEIMQGAMEIVQTTKRGNKTVYNRYRVK